MTSGSLVETARPPMACDISRCIVARQLLPPFMLFHTPPLAEPAYRMSPFVGWIAMHLIRPLTLVGPTDCQVAAGGKPRWTSEKRIADEAARRSDRSSRISHSGTPLLGTSSDIIACRSC